MRGPPSPPCQIVEVEGCLGPAVAGGYRETRAAGAVVEVPSRVRVEEGEVLPCQGGAGVEEVPACQGGAGVAVALACLAKEVAEECWLDPVEEGGVEEQVRLHSLASAGEEAEGVEGAYLHFGRVEEGGEAAEEQ